MKKTLIAMSAVAAMALAACAGDDAATETTNQPDEVTTSTTQVEQTTTTVPGDDLPALDDRSPASYVGLGLQDAEARAADQDRPARVIKLDGEPQDMEDDLQMSRLNFTVVDGVVTDAQTDLQLVEEATGRSVSEFFVGMDAEAALAAIEDQGRAGRIVKEDGEDLMVTQDFIADRLNLTVEGGTVVDAVTDAEIGER